MLTATMLLLLLMMTIVTTKMRVVVVMKPTTAQAEADGVLRAPWRAHSPVFRLIVCMLLPEKQTCIGENMHTLPLVTGHPTENSCSKQGSKPAGQSQARFQSEHRHPASKKSQDSMSSQGKTKAVGSERR